MICWLQDFFKNWAVAVEALATVALVIAAFIQWGTMRAQARQERDRWKREDEIRAEEKKPKAEFGLRHKTDRIMELWCANLGSVSFLVTKMLIDLAPAKRTSYSALRRYGRSSADGAFTEEGIHVRIQA